MFDLDRWNEIIITISRNKTRSILTAFGVFWGVFMLILLAGGGNGLTKLITGQFEGMASNSCIMFGGRTSEPYKGFRKGRYWQINNRDIEIIKAKVSGLDEISPIIYPGYNNDNVVRNDKKGTFPVQGNYAEHNKLDRHTMMYGRYLNAMDVLENRKVCVIGTRVYETLFNRGEDPVGQEIRVNGIYFKVIGVGNGNDNFNFGGNKRELVTLPLTVMQKLYSYGSDRVDMFMALAQPKVAVSEIQDEIATILKVNHSIAPNDKQAVNSFNLEQMFDQVNNLFLGVNILVWIVGLGTLFAGIIGVSNIMMVTVRERTQEIGVRRALGARPSSIMTQIMSESFTITATAGFLGISFAVLILQMVDLGLSSDGGNTVVFQINFYTAIVAATIITIMGTLAGLGPAFRAMKIKPIEALSEE